MTDGALTDDTEEAPNAALRRLLNWTSTWTLGNHALYEPGSSPELVLSTDDKTAQMILDIRDGASRLLAENERLREALAHAVCPWLVPHDDCPLDAIRKLEEA